MSHPCLKMLLGDLDGARKTLQMAIETTKELLRLIQSRQRPHASCGTFKLLNYCRLHVIDSNIFKRFQKGADLRWLTSALAEVGLVPTAASNDVRADT